MKDKSALQNKASTDRESTSDKPFTDVVCGMKVAANPAKSVEHNHEKFYFCSQGCMEKFRGNPAKYLESPASSHSSANQSTESKHNNTNKNAEYTCPMHAEIKQTGPGTCPICGMALEPMEATTATDDSELNDMTRRFWVSLALSLPLLLITMSAMIPSFDVQQYIGSTVFNWLQAALATPVVLWGGWPFFTRGWASFKSWNLNMFSLIALGTGASYSFSVFALLFPSLLPNAFKVNGLTPLYFEGAAVIVTLVLMGQVLELRARARTSDAIKSLLELAPNTALRVDSNGDEKENATGSDPEMIADTYTLEGVPLVDGGLNSMAFVSMFAVAAVIDESNQDWLDALWQDINKTPLANEDYYGNTLKLLSMLTITGHWQQP